MYRAFLHTSLPSVTERIGVKLLNFTFVEDVNAETATSFFFSSISMQS